MASTRQPDQLPPRIAQSLLVGVAGYAVLVLLVLLFPLGVYTPLMALVGVAFLVACAAGPWFGLLAAVMTSLLIPLAISVQVGPFGASPARLVSLTFLVGWLAALSRRNGPLVRRTPLDGVLLAGLFVIVASLVANTPSFDGPQFGAGVLAVVNQALDFVVFYWAAVSVLGSDRERLERFLRVLGVTMIVISVIAIYDWVSGRNVFEFIAPVLPGNLSEEVRTAAEATDVNFERGGLRRALGTFTNPNSLGMAIALGLPVLMHLGATARQRRPLYLGGATLAVVAGIMTISRSVFISIAIVVLVYLVATRRVRGSGVAPVLVATAVLVALVASPGIRDTMAVYFEGLAGGDERSVQARLKDYDNVLAQFEETPLLGSGPGTWTVEALSRPGNGRVDPADPGQVVLDNLFLSTLAERGGLGILTVAALFLAAIAVASRGVRSARDPTERSLRAALLSSIVAFTVLGFFFDTFGFYGPTKLFYVLLAAMVVACGQTRAFTLSAPPSGTLEDV